MEDDYHKALSNIQQWTEEKIGLNPNSMGLNNWIKCVEQRMAACNITDIRQYNELLRSSLAEPQRLIDVIVIPETWFFREPKGYKIVCSYVNENLSKFRGGTPLKILSIGCSTGEEPYSIAMTLLDEGFVPGSFRIEAFDVSQASLNKAIKGIYGENSFRNQKLSFRNRFFEKSDLGYKIKKEVQSTVNFFKANVLNTPSFRHDSQFDIIFCKNLLIYLTQKNQESLMKRIVVALKPNGIVILGEAELSKMDQKHLKIENYQGIGGIYSKKFSPSHTNSYLMVEVDSDDNKIIDGHDTKKTDFEYIKKLANEGDLESAETILTKYMNEYGKDADSIFLQGLIEHARGKTEKATENFKKAIYMNPNHYESLVYLSLLTEGQTAEHYRLRAQGAKRDKSGI